ncbi:MAG: hypothetical protein KAW61_03285, partial [candidate division Zixibacteria bacterium]|nr:hypothetical protein [candidate division Zixibacteria bacterium]
MKAHLPTDITPQDQLTAMIARKQVTARSTILPFADNVDLLSDLFSALGCPASRLVAAGHVTPEVAQAADRARIELEEQLTPSPFGGDPKVVKQAVS